MSPLPDFFVAFPAVLVNSLGSLLDVDGVGLLPLLLVTLAGLLGSIPEGMVAGLVP